MKPLPFLATGINAAAVALLMAPAFVTSVTAAEVDYEKDLLPILMKKCADCHSTKSEKVKGGLKFDDLKHFQSQFGDGKSWVIPGNWDSSQLFLTVFRPQEEKEAMPRKGKGERLNLNEVKLVMHWIADGAPINGERGPKGSMPEKIEDLFLDLPPDLAEKLKQERAVKPGEELSPSPDSGPGTPMPPREQDWTNREGRTIRATLLRLNGDQAILRLPDGREVPYPMANLSDESQAQARKSAGGQ
ncbi:MAG: hypothetical protein KDM64_13785 [Verrucomicrobiae bacterium]|nr:hypothetical protein [Verrucomicrobiae bacterium]